MKEYGLIGEKLGHSFSREIHNMIGRYDYELIELAPAELEDFLRRREFRAVNVTIPYKKAVIPFLDSLTAEAAEIGAVNCIRNEGGRLVGHNTDFAGLRALLAHAGAELSGRKVLILGTGGTSDTAAAVCRSLGAGQIFKVSRSGRQGALSYEQALREHNDAQVILNTTPCGMYPHIAESPLAPEAFAALESVIDVIYNPLASMLVLAARQRGARAEGGLYMLVAQAVFAAEFFLQEKLPAGLTEEIYRRLLRQKSNIVLTGMPSSGKSAIGRLVANKLGRRFYDIDALVEEEAGMSIAEIFRRDGEAEFRRRESAAAARLAACNGIVIATGGGTVIDPQNARLLAMNGRLYFLDRPLALLTPTSDRPTASDRRQLQKRYEERYDIYRSTADVTVVNDGTRRQAAEKILEDYR